MRHCVIPTEKCFLCKRHNQRVYNKLEVAMKRVLLCDCCSATIMAVRLQQADNPLKLARFTQIQLEYLWQQLQPHTDGAQQSHVQKMK